MSDTLTNDQPIIQPSMMRQPARSAVLYRAPLKDKKIKIMLRLSIEAERLELPCTNDFICRSLIG